MEGWGWGQEYYTVNVNVRWDGEGFGWGKIWKRRREIKVAGEVGGHREVAVDPGGGGGGGGGPCACRGGWGILWTYAAS